MIYDATLSRGDHMSSVVSLEIIELIIRSDMSGFPLGESL